MSGNNWRCRGLAALLLLVWLTVLASPALARRHGAVDAGQTTVRTRLHSSKGAPQPVAEPLVPDFSAWSGGLVLYDPAKDTTPKEDVPVEETEFLFVGPLFLRPVTLGIVIHHVGVPSGDLSAERIHWAHIGNGWNGIGYHYVIRQDGTIERGRPLATIGAHAYGFNESTVGINLSGNFDWEFPSYAQLDALTGLLASLCGIYGLKPGEATISGHCDMNLDTACPGRNLYPLLPGIREDVAELMAASGKRP